MQGPARRAGVRAWGASLHRPRGGVYRRPGRMHARPQRQLRSIGLVLAALVAAPAASAQPKPPATAAAPSKADQEAAKKKLAAGKKLLDAKSWQAALAELEAAYALDPKPAALLGKARAERELGRRADAYASYERARDQHAKELDFAQRAEVDKALKELALVTGTLAVRTSEAGATVTIDGKPAGTTPLAAPVRLDEGTHAVRIEKPGFDPVEKQVAVAGQKAASIDLPLAKTVTVGHLAVREQDGSAVRVLVDGKDVGPAPWEGDLAPGTHRIALQGDKLASPPQTVEVKVGSRSNVVLDAKATSGHVSIATTPSDATIEVDGKPVGTGTWEGDVAPGSHEIKVTATGHEPLTRTVQVAEGQRLDQQLALAAAAAAPTETPPSDLERTTGFYLNWSLFGATTLTSHPAVGCSDDATCKDLFPIGGGSTLRAGYMFDWIGFEAVGGFLAQTWFANRTVSGSSSHPAVAPGDLPSIDASYTRDESYQYLDLAGFAGLGARVASHGEGTRFTGGLAAGATFHQSAVHREVSGGVSDKYTASTNYRGPGVLLDGAVLFGSTPGTRFSLGLLAWIDYVGSQPIRTGSEDPHAASIDGGGPAYLSTPGFAVAKGTQVYVGPTFGVQFAH